MRFTLSASLPADVGVWSVTVAGSIVGGGGGPFTNSFSFTMTIKSDCEMTPTIIDSNAAGTPN
jgi:hypothetical protein